MIIANPLNDYTIGKKATRTDGEIREMGDQNLSPSGNPKFGKNNLHRQTADIDQLNVGKY